MSVQNIQLLSALLQLAGWIAPVVMMTILLFRINIRYGVGIGGARMISGGSVIFLVLLFKAFWQFQFGAVIPGLQVASHMILLAGSSLVLLGTSQLFETIFRASDSGKMREKKKKIWITLLLVSGGFTASSILCAMFRMSPIALLADYTLYNLNVSITACIYLSFALLRISSLHQVLRRIPLIFYTGGMLLLGDGVLRTYYLEFGMPQSTYVVIRFVLNFMMAAIGTTAVILAYMGTNRISPMLEPASVKDSILHYKLSVQKRFVIVLTISIAVIGATGYVILEVIQSGKRSIEGTYLNEQRKVAESVAANMEGINGALLLALKDIAVQPSVREIRVDSMKRVFRNAYEVWKNVAYTISRTDEHGILRYTYPEMPGSIGRDISYQPHVRRFLVEHDTLFTGAFRSIQGEYAFAMYVPVYAPNPGGNGTHFAGGVAILLYIDAYAVRAFRNTSIFTPNPLAAVNSEGKVIVASRNSRSGQSVQDYLQEIFPSVTNRDSLDAVAKRMSALATPAFIPVVNSILERKPQWLVAHPVRFSQKPWGVIILPVSNAQVFAVYTETVGKQMMMWGFFAVILVLLMSTVVIIFYRWSRFLEEEVNHELAVVREAEGKYAKLVNEAVVGIFQTTADGRLTSANPSMASMLAYESPDALTASDVFRLRAGHDHDPVPWDVIRSCAGIDTHVSIRKADGSVMNALVHCKAVGDGDGGIDRYEGFIEDVTERKRLEQQLIQSQKLEGIGTLAGGIAHDFNNLLAMILGSAELLRIHTGDSSQLKKYVDRIIEASERGASISRQLLIFSRPDQAELKPVSLSQIVAELDEMLRHFLPKSITIETHHSSGGSIIMGDRGHLHQALLNLALNANDAMPEGGLISISEFIADSETIQKKFPSSERQAYAAVSVADTGMGMDETMKAKIFDPFFSTKERGKGTGLGLAIVHGIVKSHKGFVDVESVVRKGTVFTVYFPVFEGSAEPRD